MNSFFFIFFFFVPGGLYFIGNGMNVFGSFSLWEPTCACAVFTWYCEHARFCVEVFTLFIYSFVLKLICSLIYIYSNIIFLFSSLFDADIVNLQWKIQSNTQKSFLSTSTLLSLGSAVTVRLHTCIFLLLTTYLSYFLSVLENMSAYRYL